VSSRTVRRARHKWVARIEAQPQDKTAKEAAGILVQWWAEARRRARSLGAPAVWTLARDPDIHQVAQKLDPTGGLRADLNWICAEAVAEVAGRHLVGGSRPLADRSRRERAGKR
jgi:hypothetical protein